jgi:hypothetical protein
MRQEMDIPDGVMSDMCIENAYHNIPEDKVLKVGKYLEDILEAVFLPEDRAVVEAVFLNRGAVYGGYLRDRMSGNIPNDIDVALSAQYWSRFKQDLTKLGPYTFEVNEEHGTIIATLEDKRKVEIVLVEDNPDDTIIGPCAEPDFNINLMSTDGLGVLCWTGGDDLEQIRTDCDRKYAKQCPEASQDRIDTMKAKGYTIY